MRSFDRIETNEYFAKALHNATYADIERSRVYNQMKAELLEEDSFANTITGKVRKFFTKK